MDQEYIFDEPTAYEMRVTVLKKMVKQGILIMEGSRVKIARDLITAGLALGTDQQLFGKPCVALHGLTTSGFQLLRSIDAGIVENNRLRESFHGSKIKSHTFKAQHNQPPSGAE